jgi:chromosome segregation ATPase
MFTELPYGESGEVKSPVQAQGKAEESMTPEEVERTIQFILQHEAQVFARIDRLSEASERHEKAIERHDNQLSQLTDLIGRLAQAEIRLVERMDTLAERMDAMAAVHKETGERLNALIVTVERYIAGPNGDRA